MAGPYRRRAGGVKTDAQGASYAVFRDADGNSFEVTGLSAGKHTLEVSLRNADHSAAGPTDTATITVTGGATSSSTASPTGGGGYSYGGGSYGGGGG